MTQITFISASGDSKEVTGTVGLTLMEIALREDVDGITAECGGACACATCHIYVDPQFSATLPPADDVEQAMLEFATDVQPNSRLSCQIEVTAQMSGLRVTTPASQG